MTKLRMRIALLLTWLLVFFNIERFHEPINIASFVYVLAAMIAIVVVVLRGETRIRFGALVGAMLALFLALKWGLGYSILGAGLPLTVTETCALLITAVLVGLIAQGIREFEENAQQVLHMHFDSHTPDLDVSQIQLYREVRSARRHGRPLSLLALSVSNATSPALVARYLEEIQQRGIRKYIDARLAQLINGSISDCDILAYRDDCFFVLCPELSGDAAQEVVQRLELGAREQLGLELNIGSACFPDEEVTLGGLLDKAAGAMRGKTPTAIATPQGLEALDTPAPSAGTNVHTS